jgi:16S rRNA processing protein RimM
LVKLKTFTETPEAVCAYGPLHSEDGTRRFIATHAQKPKGQIAFVRLAGVETREAAEALKGTRLYVDRAVLPATDPDDFYVVDLIGLGVEDPSGASLGRVKAVHNHGAGDVLEVALPTGGQKLFAFTAEVVPVVDIAGGRLVVNPPAEVDVGPEGEGADAADPDADPVGCEDLT